LIYDYSTQNEDFRNRVARSTAQHPCYNAGAHGFARMHIPVAPACNIHCNYCNRKYDCANESRPGVTSEVLNAGEALARFIEVKGRMDNLRVVGIAGPGDALAEFEKTRAAVELIRAQDPDVTLCLSTNGLLLPRYADALADLGIGHVTVTINAVDPEIGSKIYRSVTYDGRKYTGREAAALLMENQLEGLWKMAAHGAACKVNIVMISGVNDAHIEDIVKTAKNNGAYITNIMPLIPVEGTPFGSLPATGQEEVAAMRRRCEKHMRQMHHCRQCRADAVGTLNNDRSAEFCGAGCGPIKKIV